MQNDGIHIVNNSTIPIKWKVSADDSSVLGLFTDNISGTMQPSDVEALVPFKTGVMNVIKNDENDYSLLWFTDSFSFYLNQKPCVITAMQYTEEIADFSTIAGTLDIEVSFLEIGIRVENSGTMAFRWEFTGLDDINFNKIFSKAAIKDGILKPGEVSVIPFKYATTGVKKSY